MASRRKRVFATHGEQLFKVVNWTALRYDAECSVLQLRQKIRQIKELSLRLNLPLPVELEEADAFQEEYISGFRKV